MSKAFYLVTAFGKDRPGMVAGLTRLVYGLGGNVEDASMTRLGGEFGMMLVVGLPGSAAGAGLLKALPGLERKLGLALGAKPISQSLAQTQHRSQATHLISVYGTDRPGIIYKAAKTLADQRVNITDLNTRTLQRSRTGGQKAGKPLYVMLLEVQIPSRAKAAAVQRRLQQLGRSLHLDVTVQEIDAVSL